jgi:hypothetical protein
MAFQQIPFRSDNIGAMPEWQRNAILSGQIKTDPGTLANARNWQFMNAAGYKQATTVNDIPAGSTTFALTSAPRTTQVPASYGKDSRGTMTAPGVVQNWYKPPQPQAAAAAPAAPAAAAPAAQSSSPTQGGANSSSNGGVTNGSERPFSFNDYVKGTSSSVDVAEKPEEETNYDRWLANRNSQTNHPPTNDSGGPRYEYGDLKTPWAHNRRVPNRSRKAADGDFQSALTTLTNYVPGKTV